MAESVKNGPAGTKEFFGTLLQLKSKNSEQMEDNQLYGAYCQNNTDQKDDLVIYNEYFRQADIICF